MRITSLQLRQIIREEIQRLSTNEAKQDNLQKMKSHNDAIAKLQKDMTDAKTPAAKAKIQKRLAARKQRLSNLKVALTKGR